jgi:hypothetical protein
VKKMEMIMLSMNLKHYTLRALASVGVLAGLAFSQAASAATYYVATNGSDSAPGTQAAPWRSIAKAASTMVGGDTAIVNAGSYGEKTNTVRSGSEGKRITFRASGKVVTKAFNINHAYVTVDGFEMTAANEGYTMTITGSYCELLNNTIHNTGATWGIVRMNSGSMTGCLIKNNRYYGSTGPGDDLPVFIVSGTNHILEGNEIGPGKDLDAFRVWGVGHVIRGNYIHDFNFSSSSSRAHMDAIQTFCIGGGESRSITFEDNLVVNLDGQIAMTENNGSPGCRDWDVRNNIYVNVRQQASVGIPNFRFYNNTLYNVGGETNLVMYMYDAAGKSDYTGATIRNNLIVTGGTISNYSQVMSVGRTGSNVQISNNFVTKMNGFGGLAGNSEPSGVNGGDPKFIDASRMDFSLQSNSPAINRGATATAAPVDYEGVARPQGGGVDIGAFEYVGGGTSKAPAAPTNVTVR